MVGRARQLRGWLTGAGGGVLHQFVSTAAGDDGQRAGREVHVSSLSHYLEMGFAFLKVGGDGGNSEDGDGKARRA
jgi:hypothetical protein